MKYESPWRLGRTKLINNVRISQTLRGEGEKGANYNFSSPVKERIMGKRGTRGMVARKAVIKKKESQMSLHCVSRQRNKSYINALSLPKVIENIDVTR